MPRHTSDNKDQNLFDPRVAAMRVPHTHSVTRDQKDFLEQRSYKADKKDVPPPRETFTAEPYSMLQVPEHLRELPLNEPEERRNPYMLRPKVKIPKPVPKPVVAFKPFVVVEDQKNDSKDSFVFIPPESSLTGRPDSNEPVEESEQES